MQKSRSEFVENLNEVFADFGAIGARRMFGGYGIYHDDLMFGLVADDVLYLKADKESEEHFSSRGLERFEYIKNGKATQMSYFMVPEEIFEDRSEARKWAMLAYDAALRNKQKGRKQKKPRVCRQ